MKKLVLIVRRLLQLSLSHHVVVTLSQLQTLTLLQTLLLTQLW